eukprot:scaffold2117_cov241-Pinguiococcus_pyrenoidosus.AAC.15
MPNHVDRRSRIPPDVSAPHDAALHSRLSQAFWQVLVVKPAFLKAFEGTAEQTLSWISRRQGKGYDMAPRSPRQTAGAPVGERSRRRSTREKESRDEQCD